MRGRPLRLVLAIVGGAFVVVVVVSAVAIWWPAGGPAVPPAMVPPMASGPRPTPAAGAPSSPRVPEAEPGPAPAGEDVPEAAGPVADDGAPEDASEGPDPTPWAAVDLGAVRAAMPDNLYWAMAAPTKDQALLRWREEERERWNVEYGKVLSNTATKEEVDAYYAHRQRLSTDYIEFAGYLLTGYSDKLAKRDLALLKLALELHYARLEEIPRQLAEAHQRREAHDAARRAWLDEQKAFERSR